MFFSMFKERNEYGLSLIVCSFASFFMLPGLSSVSHAKSVHEKGHMKSMMDQKVSYRILVMASPLVTSETGKPQPVEAQAFEDEAVASQGVEGVSGDQSIVVSFLRPSLESRVFEPEIAETQGVESDIYEPFGNEPFQPFVIPSIVISFFISLVDILLPQPVEPSDVSLDVDRDLPTFSPGIEVEIIQDESHPVLRQEPAFPAAGTQVEPQAPEFEASPDVDAAQNAFIGPIVVNVDHNSNNSNVDVNSCCRSSLQ